MKAVTEVQDDHGALFVHAHEEGDLVKQTDWRHGICHRIKTGKKNIIGEKTSMIILRNKKYNQISGEGAPFSPT